MVIGSPPQSRTVNIELRKPMSSIVNLLVHLMGVEPTKSLGPKPSAFTSLATDALVPGKRFELLILFRRGILSPLCMPLHHPGWCILNLI